VVPRWGEIPVDSKEFGLDRRSLQARLRALAAIPEHQRSEAQWDEMVEIEIRLGPGNGSSRVEAAGRPKQPRQTPRRKLPDATKAARKSRPPR
jgi:hypothetical protein